MSGWSGSGAVIEGRKEVRGQWCRGVRVEVQVRRCSCGCRVRAVLVNQEVGLLVRGCACLVSKSVKVIDFKTKRRRSLHRSTLKEVVGDTAAQVRLATGHLLQHMVTEESGDRVLAFSGTRRCLPCLRQAAPHVVDVCSEEGSRQSSLSTQESVV